MARIEFMDYNLKVPGLTFQVVSGFFFHFASLGCIFLLLFKDNVVLGLSYLPQILE